MEQEIQIELGLPSGGIIDPKFLVKETEKKLSKPTAEGKMQKYVER